MDNSCTDFQLKEISFHLRKSKRFFCSIRLHIIKSYLDNISNSQTARLLNVSRKTVVKWVERYKKFGIDGFKDKPRPGRPSLCSLSQAEAIKARIQAGPLPDKDKVAVFTAKDILNTIFI